MKIPYTNALTLNSGSCLHGSLGCWKSPVVAEGMSLSRVLLLFMQGMKPRHLLWVLTTVGTSDGPASKPPVAVHNHWITTKPDCFFTNSWKKLCFLYLSVHIRLIFFTWSNHSCWLLQPRNNRKPTLTTASMKTHLLLTKGLIWEAVKHNRCNLVRSYK